MEKIKADKEKAEFWQGILEFIADQDTTFKASEIAAEFGISPQQASDVLNDLVAEGALQRIYGKKRAVLYAIADAE